MSVAILSACSEDDPVTPPTDHEEAIGMVLYSSGVKVFSILRGVTTDTLRAETNVLSDHYEVRFYDEDENVFEADAEHHSLSWAIADTTIVQVVQEAGEEGAFEFHLRGKTQGKTTIEFFILHEGHSDFRTGSIPVVVR